MKLVTDILETKDDVLVVLTSAGRHPIWPGDFFRHGPCERAYFVIIGGGEPEKISLLVVGWIRDNVHTVDRDELESTLEQVS